MSELIRQINANVQNSPDFTVIVDQGENNRFTFAQLDAYARKIAGKLVRRGVGERDFVTIELPRNKEYLASMYAVWLVGGAFVPLSPAYPVERLEYIRSDCKAKAIINEKFLKRLDDEEPFEGIVETADDDPSLLIYTSGSTGKARVFCTRTAASAILLSAISNTPMRRRDTVPLWARRSPLSHRYKAYSRRCTG